jgi:hypothetical protein
MNRGMGTLGEIIMAYQGTLFPPVDNGRLALVVKRSRRELGADLPDDYMAFLRTSNGACVDGLLVYPVEDLVWQDTDLPGIIEINLRRRAYRDGLGDLVILGEVDDDFLVYRRKDAAFGRVDRLSLDFYDGQASLAAVVAGVLEPARGDGHRASETAP